MDDLLGRYAAALARNVDEIVQTIRDGHPASFRTAEVDELWPQVLALYGGDKETANQAVFRRIADNAGFKSSGPLPQSPAPETPRSPEWPA